MLHKIENYQDLSSNILFHKMLKPTNASLGKKNCYNKVQSKGRLLGQGVSLCSLLCHMLFYIINILDALFFNKIGNKNVQKTSVIGN